MSAILLFSPQKIEIIREPLGTLFTLFCPLGRSLLRELCKFFLAFHTHTWLSKYLNEKLGLFIFLCHIKFFL